MLESHMIQLHFGVSIYEKKNLWNSYDTSDKCIYVF